MRFLCFSPFKAALFLVLFSFGALALSQFKNTLDLQDETDRNAIDEQLQWYINHPVDLNRCSRRSLADFALFETDFIDSVLANRNRYGPFKSHHDFIGRLKLNNAQYQIMAPYIRLTCKTEKKTNGHCLVRVTQQSAHNAPFPFRCLLSKRSKRRVDLTVNRPSTLSFRLSGENDAGETPLWDHLPWYIHYQKKTWQMLAGSYQLHFGLGIVMGGPFPTSTSRTLDSSVQTKNRLKGHASGLESRYLQGACLRWKTYTCFFSSMPLDAAIDSLGQIQNIFNTGQHISELEKKRRHTARERIAGIRVTKQFDLMVAGMTSWCCQFSHPVSHQSAAEKQYGFSGKQYCVTGIDCSIRKGPLALSGELGYESNQSLAFSGRIRFSQNAFTVNACCLHIPPDYYNHHNQLNDNNVQTLAMGIRYSSKPVKICAMLQQTRRPWRTWRIPMPHQYHRLHLQLTWQANRSAILRINYQAKTKPRLTEGRVDTYRVIHGIQNDNQQQWHFQWQWQADSRWQIKHRLSWIILSRKMITDQIVYFSPTAEQGLLMSAALIYAPSVQWRIVMGYAQAKTDSWDTALYQYEYDLPGVLTIQPLHRESLHWYILIQKNRGRWQISAKINSRRETLSQTFKKKLSLQLNLIF